MSSDWPILTKLRCKLQRGCYTQATCLATLRKVEGRSTFLATRNATIAVAKWGVTREFFLATCNATFVALQVARKIASCNMAFMILVFVHLLSEFKDTMNLLDLSFILYEQSPVRPHNNDPPPLLSVFLGSLTIFKLSYRLFFLAAGCRSLGYVSPAP